jgi:hypothetical protein
MFGVSGGIAAYVEVLGRFAFTPYILGLANLTRPGFRNPTTCSQGLSSFLLYTL